MISREMSNTSGYRTELTEILESIKNRSSNDDITISRIKALILYGKMYNINATSLKTEYDNIIKSYSLSLSFIYIEISFIDLQ